MTVITATIAIVSQLGLKGRAGNKRQRAHQHQQLHIFNESTSQFTTFPFWSFAVVIVSPLNYLRQFAENGQVESTSPRPVNSRAWPSPGRLPQWRPYGSTGDVW